MTQKDTNTIAPLASGLFAPLGNLFNLLSGTNNFPIIHQIITMLSTLPLVQVLWSLKRILAFNQGSINHDEAGNHTVFTVSRFVSEFWDTNESLFKKLPGRKVELVIGTIEELFGTDVVFKSPARLLDPGFLESQGLELCMINDAIFVPIKSLSPQLRSTDVDRVVLGTKPIEGLKSHSAAGTCDGSALLVWKRRKEHGNGRRGEEYIRLETCPLGENMDIQYTKWIFIKRRSAMVI